MDITTDTFVDTNEGGPSEFYYPNELQPGSSAWSDATFHANTVTDLPEDGSEYAQLGSVKDWIVSYERAPHFQFNYRVGIVRRSRALLLKTT